MSWFWGCWVGLRQGLIAPGGLVVAEHRRKHVLADTYGRLKRVRVLEQGDAGG